MSHYSREEIIEMLDEENGQFYHPLQRKIVSQLLEENRILREGFINLKSEIGNFDWGCESCGGSFEHNEESLCYFIDETFSKADSVGKEKG